MVPQSSAVLGGMPTLLVVLVMETLVAPQGIPTHLVRLFEVWLVLDLVQNLMHRLSEHGVNHLRNCWPRLPSKIPLRSIIIVAVRLEIPPLLRDKLTLSFALLLVLLDLLIFINPIHELVYAGNRLPGQRFP